MRLVLTEENIIKNYDYLVSNNKKLPLIFALFKGFSITSKLIKFWTRSNFSHAAFVNPEFVVYDTDSGICKIYPYKDGSLIEAWSFGSIFNTHTDFSSLKNHTPRTPVLFYHLLVEPDQLIKALEFQKTLAFNKIPYDWIAIIAFVIPFKLKRNGKLFCSEKETLCLNYSLDTDFPSWKISPDEFQLLLEAINGGKIRPIQHIVKDKNEVNENVEYISFIV